MGSNLSVSLVLCRFLMCSKKSLTFNAQNHTTLSGKQELFMCERSFLRSNLEVPVKIVLIGQVA